MDVIVLDIMLPIKSGIEILQQIRDQEYGITPVLMLTAKGTIDDKVAPDLGAE